MSGQQGQDGNERPKSAPFGDVVPSAPGADPRAAPAVCVLGCPGAGPLERRARAAAAAFAAERADVVVACGRGRGLRTPELVEADALAQLLVGAGVPATAIVRERSSRDTFENAAEAARIVGDRPVVLVTCAWHLSRARLLFERAGVRVVRGVGAPAPPTPLLRRAWWRARERVSLLWDLRR